MSDTNETSPPAAAPPEGSVWKARHMAAVGTVHYTPDGQFWYFTYEHGVLSRSSDVPMFERPHPGTWEMQS